MLRWGTRGLALIIAALIHVALLLCLLSVRPQAFMPLRRVMESVAEVFIVQVPPPPVVLSPEPPPQAAKQAQLPSIASPRKTPESKLTEADDGPPIHGMGGNGEWAGITPSPNAITLAPRRVPSDYADKVKARVVANLVRPDGAVYKAQPGEKSDARSVLRQCTIPYEITVDRQGKVLSFQIESCGDKLLDAAAEAALQKSGPFPPPPNSGAATYVIYGSANFRAQ